MVSAQVDFWALVSQGGSEIELPPEGAVGRADFDRSVTLTGLGDIPVSISAPQDDAIFVVHEGGNLTARNVMLKKSGIERFAVYINGGRLRLEDCIVEGAFDTAFYVGAGQLELVNCEFEGNANGALAASGIVAQNGTEVVIQLSELSGVSGSMFYAAGASVVISDTSLADAGQNSLLLISGSKAEVDGLTVSGVSETQIAVAEGASLFGRHLLMDGAGASGLFAQGAAAVDLEDFVVSGGFEGGVIVQRGGSVSIDGFTVRGSASPIQITNQSGPVVLRNGRVSSTSSGAAVVVADSPDLSLDWVKVEGGDVGILLTGLLDRASLSNSVVAGQRQYAVALQDVRISDGEVVPILKDNIFVSDGEALGLFAADAGTVRFRGNRLLAQGESAIYLDSSYLVDAADNLVIAAPSTSEVTRLLKDLKSDGPTRVLADGQVSAIEGYVFPEAGVVTITAAGLVSSDGLSAAEKFALADFASASSPADLDLLALALKQPSQVSNFAEKAGVLVDLAAPEGFAGWLWDAVKIVLKDPAGRTTEARPNDFPLHLLPGSYSVSIDGLDAGVVAVSGAGLLALPELNHPYLISRDEEGRLWRGAYLRLRAPNALAKILDGWRPLRVGEWMGNAAYMVPRDHADRSVAAALIVEARQRLAGLEEELVAAREAEDYLLVNRRWQERRMLLEILGAFGSPSDVDWLINELVANGAEQPAANVAVRAEARLGRLSNGPLRQLVVGRLAGGLDDPLAKEVVLGMARLGDRWALSVLSAMRAAAVEAAAPSDAVPWGVDTLILADPAVALGHMRDYLTRLSALGPLYGAGQEIDWSSLNSSAAWRSAGLAMAYLARYGTVNDLAYFNIPIPAAAGFDGLLPFANYGPGVIAHYLDDLPDNPPSRINGWPTNFGLWLCAARTLADDEVSEVMMLGMQDVVSEAIRRLIVTDYWDGSQEDRQRTDRSIAFGLDLSASHCDLNGSVTELAMSEDAAGEEGRKFAQSSYDPVWWERPLRASSAMTALANPEEYPRLWGLSQYDSDWLMDIFSASGGIESDLTRIFATHHRLMTDAFVSPQANLAFQSDRRVFRLRSGGGDGSISIAGQVDVRPIPQGDRLTIAIRHDIKTLDYGGLAAAIAAPDREPYERDNRRAMFETVVLEQAGARAEANLVAATPEGVLLFEVPYSGGFEDAYIHIGMRFVETRWSLEFSLFDSPLAVDRRRQARPVVEDLR